MNISDMASLDPLVLPTGFVDRVERQGDFDELLAVGGVLLGHGVSRGQ